MSTKQNVGLAGSLVLIVGLFLPYLSDPVEGTVSYWANGGGGGGAILLFALCSVFLVIVNKSIPLWYTGLATAALLTYNFVEYQFAREDSLHEAKADSFGLSLDDFSELAIAAPQLVELQYGFFVLVVGAILVLAGAILTEEAPA